MTLVAQLAQSVSSMGVGGAGATQQIIFQIDSRTIAQAAVQGMPPIVRVSAGLRGM
jgi:predicted ATP-grasp superfamily ATP-dependent carboligase